MPPFANLRQEVCLHLASTGSYLGSRLLHRLLTGACASRHVLPPRRRLRVQDNGQKLICHDCKTPVAEIKEGVLIIEARHHGERHVTLISLRKVLDSSTVVVLA